MKQLEASNRSMLILLDDDIYDKYSRYSWQIIFNTYNSKPCGIAGRIDSITYYLTHLILGRPSKGFEIDHKDGDILNCQRENLRFVTFSQNQWNKGIQSNNSSGYKGVSWNKLAKKWKVSIRVKTIGIHLGYFSDLDEVAEAYNKAAKAYFGEYACLNVISKMQREIDDNQSR